jgi:small subunit ribosomal protein S12
LRRKKTRVKELHKCPQKKGICIKLIIMTPRKPCSAKRKIAKVYLSTKRYIFAYIPGERHTLQKYSRVLIRGGLIRDLPGVHYTMIRGKFDLEGIQKRRQGRSKYGTIRWYLPKKRHRAQAKAKEKLTWKVIEK